VLAVVAGLCLAEEVRQVVAYLVFVVLDVFWVELDAVGAGPGGPGWR